jgi:endonuclease/exonuclease/phosphatase family metal-dependent hydrolase
VSVRLATLNTWGTRGDWDARRSILSRGFAELGADLVTLQETIVTDGSDQAREILGDGYHLVHQTKREPDGQGITTASRWPIRQVLELDLHVTERTAGFASTCLIAEIAAPEPLGRIWLANHLPDWQLDHEHERQSQALVAARALEALHDRSPGHVIVAGDLDADADATSVRFWTGRDALDGLSVGYRDAWVSANPHDAGETFVPGNRYSADWDWPYRRIDYILVRCGRHGGPTLRITRCALTFDQPDTVASDHYGLVADLELPPPPTPA